MNVASPFKSSGVALFTSLLWFGLEGSLKSQTASKSSGSRNSATVMVHSAQQPHSKHSMVNLGVLMIKCLRYLAECMPTREHLLVVVRRCCRLFSGEMGPKRESPLDCSESSELWIRQGNVLASETNLPFMNPNTGLQGGALLVGELNRCLRFWIVSRAVMLTAFQKKRCPQQSIWKLFFSFVFSLDSVHKLSMPEPGILLSILPGACNGPCLTYEVFFLHRIEKSRHM